MEKVDELIFTAQRAASEGGKDDSRLVTAEGADSRAIEMDSRPTLGPKSGPGVAAVVEGDSRALGEGIALLQEGSRLLAEVAEGRGKESFKLESQLESLHALSKDSPELARVVEQINSGVERAQTVKRQLSKTKALTTLREHSIRLGMGVDSVVQAYSQDQAVLAAKESGARFLESLVKSDSPVVEQGKRLLARAQQRALGEGGESWGSAALTQAQSLEREGRSRLSSLLRTASGAGGDNEGGMTGMEEVLQLLQG
ncbi:unnamed protein product [Discosporangium mesarthrocarpum]